MQGSPRRGELGEALSTITEDARFATAACRCDDEDVLRGLAGRRTPIYESVGRGGQRPGLEPLRFWLMPLCTAIATIEPPAWMPMADVVRAGVSLEGGARGVRSLFTSRPSAKETDRVRRHGALAVRVLTAVMLADGPIDTEEEDLRQCLGASLGLEGDEQRALLAEPPVSVERVNIDDDVDARLARALVRGAWMAAASDGIDPREEAVITTLAKRLAVSPEDVETIRTDVRHFVEGQRYFGAASVDGVRYLLIDDQARSQTLGRLTAWLTLPRVVRAEPLASVEQGAPVTLARRYELDRSLRGAALAIAWIAALATDPSATRRAALLTRHDRFAEDLGSAPAGAGARDRVDRLVEGELLVAATAAGL